MKKHLRLAALLATTILVLSSCSTQKQVRLVLLPDIQTYSRLYPDILRSQTQWAVEHADSIDFVLQQGDMTDHNIDKEWAVAASTLNMMDDKVRREISVVHLKKGKWIMYGILSKLPE